VNHPDFKNSVKDCWLVERFFAWIPWWTLVRWEYHAHNFLGFVQLACLVILFKRF